MKTSAPLRLAMLLPFVAMRAQPPTIRVDSQLVVETVVVKDKDGRSVEGLTAKDFIITEDRVPQTVTLLEFQNLDDTLAAASASEASVQERYTNRRLLVLFFDQTSLSESDQLRAFVAATTFVRAQIKRADMVEIMSFTSRGAVRVIQNFTADRERLLDALNDLTHPETGGGNTDQGAAFARDDSGFGIFETDRKLAGLQAAVNTLKAVQGRKSLVYFSSGLRLDSVTNEAELSATVNAAIRAGVAFFPVDARGLSASPVLDDASRSSPGGTGIYSGAQAMTSRNVFQSSQDTMFALAEDTGGKALLDNNDLLAGIVQAQQAISSYYLIGYSPVHSAHDGTFRRIEVRIRAMPSARLDFRQGYYAPRTFEKFTPAEKEGQLENALLLPDPVTDIPITAEVNYFRVNSTEYHVPIAIRIPGSELAQAPGRRPERTLIDFIGEVKDESGHTIRKLRDRAALQLKGRGANELREHPVQYQTVFTLPPGKYSLKFLARDAETGRMGTWQASFLIPDLRRELQNLPISSVMLSSQRADAPGTPKLSEAASPSVDGERTLIPSVTRVFSQRRALYVYLQAYSETAGDRSFVGYVALYRGQTRAYETVPLRFVSQSESPSAPQPLLFSLSLSKLPPGEYECQVTVLNPTLRKAAFWRAPIMVVP